MELHGSLIVIICCLLFQVFNLSQNRFLFSLSPNFDSLVIVCFQGVMFLVYPFMGHLADVYLTKHRTLKYGLTTIFVSEIGGVICTVVYLITLPKTSIYKDVIEIVAALFITAQILGAGLFQATAIQFGLDQLPEASTPKLVAFIHWYYWAQNAGQLIIFYFFYGGFIAIIETCKATTHSQMRHLEYTGLAAASGVVCLIAVATTIYFFASRKHFYILRAGMNPFKTIYKVLKYSWKHKIPEHRSAFTYWEEDIPHRIDLGKNKYGGPFTNEEVEDTKTFLRILPLLLCLFGYHLAGDGYSAPLQLQATSCPSLPVLLLIVANPLHISLIIAVVGIPLYRLVIRKLFPKVLMLTKMWIGLYFSLLQIVVYIIVVVNQRMENTVYDEPVKHGLISTCLDVRIGRRESNASCIPNSNQIDNTYLWFIIPQFINGLSSLLVSMTTFEFICAQAPRTTQGLLIGLWYATFSIRYLVVGVLDSCITERRSWLISEGVKGLLILVSLVLFSYASKNYRYRQRDEIVNVQGMIEDIYNKRFDQEEEYMREQKEFYQSISGYNTCQNK